MPAIQLFDELGKLVDRQLKQNIVSKTAKSRSQKLEGEEPDKTQLS